MTLAHYVDPSHLLTTLPGKKFCSFHNTSSHSNSECRALKKDKAASAANNVGGTSESRWNPANSKARLPSGTGRPCRSCGSPWRIGHRCQQTSEPVDVPQAAFRAMSISPTLDASTSSSSDGTPVNASSPSGNSSADATVASPSGSSSSLAVCSIHATIQCLNTISRVEPNATIRSVTP
ncbi:hypothetical protein G6F70_009521 [Rhizopus microsporus]|nr:hypothetical protein G6F70_009521 [Rhizopus microsporus]KAG1205191.1 hypothetical protein G6F69_009490 [Rhizopus microsporus]